MKQSIEPNYALDAAQAKATWLELLAKGHQVEMRLGGYSMFPLLLPGDVALVQNVHDLPEPGRVLVVSSQGRWIAHRLIETIEKDGSLCFVTQGDSLLQDDGLIAKSNVVGAISSVSRRGRIIEVSAGWRSVIVKLMVSARPIPQLVARVLLKFYRLTDKFRVDRSG